MTGRLTWAGGVGLGGKGIWLTDVNEKRYIGTTATTGPDGTFSVTTTKPLTSVIALFPGSSTPYGLSKTQFNLK